MKCATAGKPFTSSAFRRIRRDGGVKAGRARGASAAATYQRIIRGSLFGSAVSVMRANSARDCGIRLGQAGFRIVESLCNMNGKKVRRLSGWLRSRTLGRAGLDLDRLFLFGDLHGLVDLRCSTPLSKCASIEASFGSNGKAMARWNAP